MGAEPQSEDTASGPEYVAVEVEEDAPADPALDAEVTDAAGAGTMIERDEIARRVRELTVDIAYAMTDRVENLKIGRGLLAGQEQRLRSLGALTGDTDIDEVNRLEAEGRALDQKMSRTEAFGKSLIDSLPGKSLADLRTYDVATAFGTLT